MATTHADPSTMMMSIQRPVVGKTPHMGHLGHVRHIAGGFIYFTRS
jgi:hypothetical protein